MKNIFIFGLLVDILLPTTISQQTKTSTAVTDLENPWLPAQNPIESTLWVNVEIQWKYKTSYLPDKIIFTRGVEDKKQEVGVWSKENNYIPGRFISTEITCNKTTNMDGTEDSITLKLRETIEKDFNQTYYAHLVTGNDNLTECGIKLTVIRPEVKMTSIRWNEENGDIKVTLTYKYKYPPTFITISRLEDDRISQEAETKPLREMGCWYNGSYKPTKDFPDKLTLDVPDTIQGEITVKILNIIAEDYNSTYVVSSVFSDGYVYNQNITALRLTEVAHARPQLDHITDELSGSFKLQPNSLPTYLFVYLKIWWCFITS